MQRCARKDLPCTKKATSLWMPCSRRLGAEEGVLSSAAPQVSALPPLSPTPAAPTAEPLCRAVSRSVSPQQAAVVVVPPPVGGRHLLVVTQGPADGLTLGPIETALPIEGVGLAAGSWGRQGCPVCRAMGLPATAGEGPGGEARLPLPPTGPESPWACSCPSILPTGAQAHTTRHTKQTAWRPALICALAVWRHTLGRRVPVLT